MSRFPDDFSPYQSPQWYGPQPPQRPSQQPGVVTWARVYFVFLALVYLALIVVGAVFVSYAAELAAGDSEHSEVEVKIMGVMFIVMGVPLTVMYIAAACVPAKPWGWILGLVAIALTLTSCWCMPIAIPLLIFWLKTDTKDWFYRGAIG